MRALRTGSVVAVSFAVAASCGEPPGPGPSAPAPRPDGWGLTGETAKPFDPSAPAGPPDMPSDTLASFRVLVPADVGRAEVALSATRALDVGAGVTISGARAAVFSDGALVVAGGTRLNEIDSGPRGGTIALGDGVAVSGRVRVAGELAKLGAVTIASPVEERAKVQAEVHQWWVTFPQAAEAPPVAAGGIRLNLQPGGFGAVTVQAASTAVLHAGEYFLDALDLQPGATLDVDDSDGPVYLWVRRDLKLAGRTSLRAGSGNLLVGFAGTSKVVVGGGGQNAFSGTLVAPLATIEIGAAAEPHRGAFFADTIIVADRTAIAHQPFASRASGAAAATGMSVAISGDDPAIESVQSAQQACQYIYLGCIKDCSGCSVPPVDAVCACGCKDRYTTICYDVPNPPGGGPPYVPPPGSPPGACAAACETQPGTPNCESSYWSEIGTCWVAETKCELNAFKSALNDISVYTTANALTGNSFANYLSRLARLFGSTYTATTTEVTQGLYLGMVQGHIMADCWPTTDVCDSTAESHMNACWGSYYGGIASCKAINCGL